MEPFEILSYKTDLQIRINGVSIKELFVNTVKALASILHHQERYPVPKQKQKIKIKSNDLNSLLIDFLNELLAKSQVNKEVYWDIHVSVLSETELEAELLGDKIEIFDEDIKTINHRDAEIKKELNHYTITVILDI